MSTPGAETVLITVNIEANTARLVELTKQLNETKEAQKALLAANKAGTLSGDELAAGQVRLKQTATQIAQETRILTKANQDQDAANKASTGSIAQLRAQLATGTASYNALSAAERDNAAAGQQLQSTNRATSDQLKVLEAAIGDTRRNVGNYTGAIGPLIQELVKLQEQQKTIPEGTAAYAQAQAKVIGFQQAVNDAGVKGGLTYDQTQAKIAGYGTAIAPVTAKIVQLEAEQKKVGEGSKEYAKIGFQIGGLKKELEKIPETAVKVGDSVDKFGAHLNKMGDAASKLPGPLGGIGSGLVGMASGLVTATRAALAFIATPIGLVLGLVAAAVYAVKTAFEGSAEGQGKYAKLMGVIGAVLGNVKDLVIDLGLKLIGAFEHPVQSLEKLGGALRDNLVNRFVGLFELLPKIGSAIVLLFQGKFAEAGKVATDAVGKVVTGVNSVTDAYGNAANAVGNFIEENKKEAALALVVRGQRAQAGKLERELITERAEAQDKVATLELKARQAEQFSGQQRRAFLLEANRINDELFAKESKVATLRRDAGALEATFAKQTKENLTEQANRAKDVIEARTRGIEARRANQRLLNSLNGQITTDAKKRATDAATAAQKQREEVVKGKQTEVERLLLTVAKGSAAELVLLQKKVDLAAEMVLTSEKKTQKDRALILETAEVDKKKLQDEFNQKAVEAAKKHDAAVVTEANREYALAEKNLQDFLDKKRALVEADYAQGKIGENEYQRQLNAIEKAGNAAALINAKDYAKDTGAIEKKAAETELARLNLIKDEKKRIASVENDIKQASFQAAAITSDLIIEAFGKESAAGQAALIIKKTLALAEIAINLEKQLSLNATAGRALDLLLPGSGIAYQIATDALAIAGALASATKIAGFATGGLVPGQGSGDSVPAMLTPGEVVLTKKTVDLIGLPMLSHLNVLGGGMAFATGGLVPGNPTRTAPVADGGFVARQMGGQAPLIDYAALAQAMAAVNLQVGVKAITRETARYNAPRGLSTLG